MASAMSARISSRTTIDRERVDIAAIMSLLVCWYSGAMHSDVGGVLFGLWYRPLGAGAYVF